MKRMSKKMRVNKYKAVTEVVKNITRNISKKKFLKRFMRRLRSIMKKRICMGTNIILLLMMKDKLSRWECQCLIRGPEIMECNMTNECTLECTLVCTLVCIQVCTLVCITPEWIQTCTILVCTLECTKAWTLVCTTKVWILVCTTRVWIQTCNIRVWIQTCNIREWIQTCNTKVKVCHMKNSIECNRTIKSKNFTNP